MIRQKSKLIKKIILSTDNKELSRYVELKEVDKIIFRPKELSESHVNLEEVQNLR